MGLAKFIVVIACRKPALHNSDIYNYAPQISDPPPNPSSPLTLSSLSNSNSLQCVGCLPLTIL